MAEPAERPTLHVAERKAPSHLRAGTRKWWRQVVEDFDLEPHDLPSGAVT